MTDNLDPSPRLKTPAITRAKTPARTAARTAAGPVAGKATSRALAAAARPGDVQVYRHPNLGLAPVDMAGQFSAAAAKIRGQAPRISTAGLEAAVKTDPTIRERYDETALRRLLRDGELLVERLAMSLASGQDRWITEYAEWLGPIERRRGVPQADLAALCAAIGGQLEPTLTADELAAATRSLAAAAAVFKRNGRVGGDRHKRNALLKWMYKGV